MEEKKVVKKATREGYAEALKELAQSPDVIVMDADLGAATKSLTFKKFAPERFFDAGIAEANMMGVAAGLATCGKTVFVSSFAMFATGRAYEQIRNSIAYPNLNVKICASHAGISVGEDGASHQCIEDISLMRSIPNMVVINPADVVEAKAAVLEAAHHEGPVYVRLGRLAIPTVFNESYRFRIGKGQVLAEGDDVTIIATGLMVDEALQAKDILAKQGISARIVNMATIKPIDKSLVIESAKKTGCIVTAEEHSVIGGLGSAVAEVLSEEYPTPLVRVGVDDTFGESGPAWELLKKYGLSAENIAKNAAIAIAKK
ncbi:MAG: transketolase family protein [Clostridia bacterium]|nr:transketolase family protein [Clostridia bacterium]